MCLTCAICHVDTQSLKFLLQGNGFSLPGHGEKLVSTKFGEEQKYPSREELMQHHLPLHILMRTSLWD